MKTYIFFNFRAKARLERARKEKEEPASLKNAKKQEQYKKLRVSF